ncbi:synphilin-1-like [Stegodyphus dumicola]|uniref:synphilin-1-like n=1 Tax=Stegodyphus dumicola TaxID=202533 RepID=UPI0015AE88F4|nr:synphilin-1-like [Stegodyphus dumicola]
MLRCNADSETCNYCRLSESSDAYEGRESSTDDERSSSSSPPKINGECRRLTRALSEDCNPPSRMRPIRRTSPGEYLRHKRNQMEKLRNDRRDSPGRRRSVTFQRCDSDPRLSFRRKDTGSPSRDVTFASPTRNRIHRSRNRARENVDSQQPDGVISKVILPVPPVNAQPLSVADTKKQKKSPLAKNISERKSRSKERGRGVVCNAEDSTPFLECGVSFRCAVCDTDIPFTNCVLCDAEAKRNFFPESLKNESAEIFLLDEELPIQDSQKDFIANEEQNIRTSDSAGDIAQSSVETKELEEFYDRPTPGNIPSSEALKKPLDDKRVKWISKGATHKSFSSGEFHSSRRKSAQLRKYHSEPMPQTEDDATDRYLQEVSEQRPSSEHSQSRAESSASSSSKSEKKGGYHVVKDSTRKEPIEKDSSNPCLVCGKTTEDGETKEKTKNRTLSPEAATQEKCPRRSPIYLKPEFYIEPEILHRANPLVDEAEVEVIPSAIGAFRRLSEEEFIATLNIHEAAKKGDLHVVKLLTKKDPKQMETVDERGWTPIHLAAAHGHAEVVKYLAMEGAHLAALDPSSYTALHLAAMNGHNSCLEVLLPMGVDVDSVTAEGFTPLHLAVMNGHLDCIQTLLQWGSSLDKRDALGRGVHDMVEEYNLEEVAALLRRFHKQLHNFKHMLDMMHRNEERSTSEIPREFMDILASIAEESGPE